MPPTTNYKFADVILVPFPFTDQTGSKNRPAVVVSSAAYNSSRPDLILMAITSQVAASAAVGEVIITDWKKAGLIGYSIIKPIVTTLEKKLVIRKLGQLNDQDRKALQDGLNRRVNFPFTRIKAHFRDWRRELDKFKEPLAKLGVRAC